MRLIEEDQPPIAIGTTGTGAGSTFEEFDIYWSDTVQGAERLLRLRPYQRMNHFPGMAVLARKNQLGKTLNAMLKKFPTHFSGFFPRTWLLPTDANEFRAYITNLQQQY